MEQTVWLGIGVIAVVIVIIFIVDLYLNNKLRKRIAYQWGKKPSWSRLDNEESLKKAWRFAQTYRQFDSEIDDITWYDLDMLETFELMNATQSSVGSEACISSFEILILTIRHQIRWKH